MTFSLKILGNNSAIPAHNRNQTAQLLVVHDWHILIDCGEGTQMQLSRYNVKLGKIKHVLISHLHGDHYFGLIGLLSTMHLYGRSAPLNIFSPPELEEILKLQLKASETNLSYPLKFHALVEDDIHTIYDHPLFTVQSFPLEHGIRCFGFLIREKPKERRMNREKLSDEISVKDIIQLKKGEDVVGDDETIRFSFKEYTLPPRKSRSYAYCSDTRYDETLVDYLKNVDLLYHEATFGEDMVDRAELTNHSTASQAATIAKKATVGKLLLGHYSTRYKDLSPLLKDARKIYTESYLSEEGQTIYLED